MKIKLNKFLIMKINLKVVLKILVGLILKGFKRLIRRNFFLMIIRLKTLKKNKLMNKKIKIKIISTKIKK